MIIFRPDPNFRGLGLTSLSVVRDKVTKVTPLHPSVASLSVQHTDDVLGLASCYELLSVVVGRTDSTTTTLRCLGTFTEPRRRYIRSPNLVTHVVSRKRNIFSIVTLFTPSVKDKTGPCLRLVWDEESGPSRTRKLSLYRSSWVNTTPRLTSYIH